MNTEVNTKVNNVMVIADELCKEREHFEEVTLARTNAELYGILTKVYALYRDAEDNNCLSDVAKEMRVNIEVRGMKVQKNTPTLTIFVRYVFNCDRKRAYKYVQVINSAIQKEVMPGGLAEYIAKNNGIEHIKSTRTKSAETLMKEKWLNDAIEVVKEELANARPLTSISIGSSVTLSDGVDFAFVIARKNASGGLDLLEAIPKVSMSMQTAAIKALAEEALEEKEVQSKQDDEAKSIEVRQKVGDSLKPLS